MNLQSMAKGKTWTGVAFAAAALVAWLGAGGTAHADAVIVSGDIALGVNDAGHLNVLDTPDVNPRGSYVGVTLLGVGDATSPGCLCEGWGASASGDSGYASEWFGGATNLTVDSFTSDATTATSVVHLTSLPDLQVTQAYQPSVTDALYEDVVTLTNLSTTDTLTDVRYTRAMDWDVPPTEFSEFVTIGGTSATALLYSDDNGFAIPDPLDASSGLDGRGDLAGCGTTTDFADCGAADHGARFDFGFGDLAPGDSVSFSIFYGGAPSEADAFAALVAVDAGLYSFGQSNTEFGPSEGTPATFIFAFGGGSIGAPPPPGGGGGPTEVPEPATIALLGSGLMGLGLFRRNRKD